MPTLMMSLCRGMYQKPAFFALGLHDHGLHLHRGPGRDRRLSNRSRPRPFQIGIFHQKFEAVADHRALAAGVDDDFGGDGFVAAIFVGDAHAHGPFPVEDDFAHADAFFSDDAVLAGVLEHHLIEFAAEDLPGLRAFVGVVIGEVEGLGKFAVLADELDGAFFDEWAGLHFVEHVEALEDPVGFGDERFADVKRGKCARSKRRTEWPFWAMRVEAVEPAGPPPITITSGEEREWVGINNSCCRSNGAVLAERRLRRRMILV